MPAGAPTVEGAATGLAGGAAPPNVSTYSSIATDPVSAGGNAAVGVATDTTGAGSVIAQGQSAQASFQSAQATAADPAGAASAEVQGRASAAAGEQSPVDPATVRSQADFASSAADNPEAAAANQVHVGVHTTSGPDGASVQVEGSASAPPIDPTKK
jgi:hypothetical protein